MNTLKTDTNNKNNYNDKHSTTHTCAVPFKNRRMQNMQKLLQRPKEIQREKKKSMSTKIRHFNNKKRHTKTPLPFRKVKAPGLERILFMRTKHNMQIFNYQSYKTTLEQQLNSEN